jgi:hypothetical protein
MMGTAKCVVCLLALCAGTSLAAPKLPVVSLAYDATVGSTETEEETLEDSSYRHQATLRIREEWSRVLVSTLVSDLTRKLAVSGGGTSYTTFQIAPQIRWNVVDALKWDATLLVRRALYDEPYATGVSRDYTRLKADTGLSLGLAAGVTLVPRLQAAFELYDDPVRSRQTYGFGVSLDARLGRWTLGADYRGSFRLGLGDLSLVEQRMDHSFGADVSWDPNRRPGSRDSTGED